MRLAVAVLRVQPVGVEGEGREQRPEEEDRDLHDRAADQVVGVLVDRDEVVGEVQTRREDAEPQDPPQRPPGGARGR